MSNYDPRSHTIKLPGRRGGPPIDYLEVAERVRWFREVHPDGVIESTIHEITDDRAIFQARVSIPGGGAATATGNESREDKAAKTGFSDYIGKAETVALGRALAILGYGIGFADEFEENRERADPRDFEVNQANTVQETAKDRFDPRTPRKAAAPPANAPTNPDVLPADPAAMQDAFDARVTSMPRPAWADDATALAQKGVQLAQNLRTNGMKDAQRKRLYPILTGMDSSKDMSPEQLALLFANSGAEGTKRLLAALAWAEDRVQGEMV